MASDPIPNLALAPTQPWFARLGISGKLMAIGAVAGIIVAFLPLASVSIELQGPGGANVFGIPGFQGGANQPFMRTNNTVMVVDNWRGKIGLVGYLAALVLAFALYPPNGLRQKELCWAAVGVGLLSVVLAIWLLILALDTGGANLMGMGMVKTTVGIGALLNVVAGAVVAAGGFLKARQETLI
jgi:hypothetical protein